MWEKLESQRPTGLAIWQSLLLNFLRYLLVMLVDVIKEQVLFIQLQLEFKWKRTVRLNFVFSAGGGGARPSRSQQRLIIEGGEAESMSESAFSCMTKQDIDICDYVNPILRMMQ